MVDQMMREISEGLFVDAAASYVTGDKSQAEDHRRLIRDAVAARVDQLNDTFVATLDAYIAAAQELEPARADVVAVLLALRTEVMAAVTEHLPPDLAVLSKVLKAHTPDARMELLRRHTRGEAEPQCDAAQLERAASQLVDDMEASAGVVDSRLLARLCLLREELQQLVDEGTNLSGLGTGNEPASGGDSAAAPGQGSSPYTLLRVVPQSTVAFIKELMLVPSSERRRALLEKAFKEDWDGGTAHVASSRPASSGPGQADGTRDASSGVRPGRLLNGIKALQAELLGPQFQSGGDGGDGGGSGSGGVEPRVLQRLEDLRQEVLLVLTNAASGTGYWL